MGHFTEGPGTVPPLRAYLDSRSVVGAEALWASSLDQTPKHAAHARLGGGGARWSSRSAMRGVVCQLTYTRFTRWLGPSDGVASLGPAVGSVARTRLAEVTPLAGAEWRRERRRAEGDVQGERHAVPVRRQPPEGSTGRGGQREGQGLRAQDGALPPARRQAGLPGPRRLLPSQRARAPPQGHPRSLTQLQACTTPICLFACSARPPARRSCCHGVNVTVMGMVATQWLGLTGGGGRVLQRRDVDGDALGRGAEGGWRARPPQLREEAVVDVVRRVVELA
eukprot:1181523-Prorocentrum_minimum.AAC.2